MRSSCKCKNQRRGQTCSDVWRTKTATAASRPIYFLPSFGLIHFWVVYWSAPKNCWFWSLPVLQGLHSFSPSSSFPFITTLISLRVNIMSMENSKLSISVCVLPLTLLQWWFLNWLLSSSCSPTTFWIRSARSRAARWWTKHKWNGVEEVGEGQPMYSR